MKIEYTVHTLGYEGAFSAENNKKFNITFLARLPSFLGGTSHKFGFYLGAELDVLVLSAAAAVVLVVVDVVVLKVVLAVA